MSRPASPPQSRDQVTLAILARVTAGLLMAVLGAFTKAAGHAGASTVELIFIRQALALPVVMIWVILGPGLGALRTKRRKAHFGRAMLGLLAMVFMFLGIKLLPLAEMVTITFIAPLIATGLSAPILGEKVGVHRWLAIGVAFVGVLIVMQPGGHDHEITTLGLTIAILAALTMAAVTLVLRQLGTTETEASTVFWFTITGTVVMGCLYPFFYQPHELTVWLMMAAVGICGAGIQVSIVMSCRLAPVSLTAPFDYMQLFWATLIGWLVWADLPAWTTVVGGLLIAGSGLYTFYREKWRRNPIAEQATPVS